MIGCISWPGRRWLVVAAALCSLTCLPANAQGPPRGPPSIGVTVLHLSDLSLGTVIAGMAASVQPTDADAGRYSVEARPNAAVQVRFALPTALQSGGSTLPVTFGQNSGAWSTQNDVTSAARFDPVEGFDARMPVSRILYVWLGAQVAPTVLQPAGGYGGTVTMTVSYN